MSNYRDFVQDFPKRCRDILNTFAAESKRQDRDVTLLLMVATAGFVNALRAIRCFQTDMPYTPDTIKAILSRGESRTVEFKASLRDAATLAKTISGFAMSGEALRLALAQGILPGDGSP